MFFTILKAITSVRVAVAGESMEPGLLHGDRLFVGRFWPHGRRIPRGAIVLTRAQSSRPRSLKRVIGLPGERVTVLGAGVLIDGAALAEPYLAPVVSSPAHSSGRTWQLGADEYLLLGDNRAHSTDSRRYGPVQQSEIAGVAWYRYAPPWRRGRLAGAAYHAPHPTGRRSDGEG